MASGTGEVHTKQLTPDMHDYDTYFTLFELSAK